MGEGGSRKGHRESLAAMPDRLKEPAPNDSSDEEWIADDKGIKTADGGPAEAILARRSSRPERPGWLLKTPSLIS